MQCSVLTHNALLFNWPYSVLLLCTMHYCFTGHIVFCYYPWCTVFSLVMRCSIITHNALLLNWHCNVLLLPMMHCCFTGDAALIYYPQCTNASLNLLHCYLQWTVVLLSVHCSITTHNALLQLYPQCTAAGGGEPALQAPPPAPGDEVVDVP